MAEQLTQMTSFDDIIFENRNKEFGSYDIRNRSVTVLLISFIISAAVFVMAVFYPIVYKAIVGEEKPADTLLLNLDVQLTDIALNKNEPPPPPPPSNIPPTPKIETARFVAFNVKKDEEVREEKLLDILNNEKQVGKVDQQGANDIYPTEELVVPEPVKTIVDDKVYQGFEVEEQAEFVGGQEALNKFLNKHITVPDEAHDLMQPNKPYRVYVYMVVNPDGSLSDFKILKGVGIKALEQEALEKCKLMPKWKPAKYNGRNVKQNISIPIVFTIAE